MSILHGRRSSLREEIERGRRLGLVKGKARPLTPKELEEQRVNDARYREYQLKAIALEHERKLAEEQADIDAFYDRAARW